MPAVRARRIVFAWELGAGLGHLHRLAAVARLLATDAEIHVVAANAPAAKAVFAGCAAAIHHAPVARASDAHGYADSYAEILLRCGWSGSAPLGALLRGWTRGLRHLAPRLVVADFAPAAMLAARVLGVPVAVIGTGFTVPPRGTPMPFTRGWDAPPPGRLHALDQQALQAANAALAALGAAPLPRLDTLFDTAGRFPCGFPELDHYPQRGGEPWHGPIYATGEGMEPEWPGLPGPRVFAYLQAGHPHALPLLGALAERGLPTAAYVPGIQPGQARVLGALRAVRLHPAPVRMGAALAGCDIVACHGVATLSAALAAGKPVLHLPGHLEQDMVLHRLAQAGLGTGVPSGAPLAGMRAALQALLADGEFAGRASAFARRHAGETPERSAQAVAAAIRALLG